MTERLTHPTGHLTQETGEGLVVFLQDPESLHLLDGPAHLVWALADGLSREELVDVLAARFPGEAALPAQVRAAVDELLSKGLLMTRADAEASDPPGSPPGTSPE